MHRLISQRLISQQLIARFLLLIALVGNLGPLALAATAAPHACCVRKAVHHCQDSLSSPSETGELVIRDAPNCSHDCCRAVPTARWAHSQPPIAVSFMQHVEAYLDRSNTVSPSAEPASFQSTRAPPAC